MTTRLPQIPHFDGTNTTEVLGAVKEALEVRVGRRGDALDAGVTFRDLESLGFVEQTSAGAGSSGLSVRANIRAILGDRQSVQIYDPAADLTTPPAPTDLKATATFGTVYLSWSQPSFNNQSYWEIHRSFSNDLSSAVLIGTATSQFYADEAGDNRTLYYWVRAVSAAAVKSAWNSAFGTEVKTSIDPGILIAALEGQILESTLSKDLSTSLSAAVDQSRSTVSKLSAEVTNRIAAINAEAVARSTAIANEAALRAAAIQAEAAARAADLSAEATARQAAITNEATIRQTADNSLSSSITTLTASVNSNAAAIQNEATARVNGDAAEASERNILATQMRGGYTGSDINAVTSGLIYQERIARSAQDSSLAQQITLLSAGSGEQFDWKSIWYFDTGVDGWSGNGTPTASGGYLRPANQASNAYVESPSGINASGSNYSQLRLRIRKVGAPTFAGYVWWRAAADSTWDVSRRATLTAPTFDGNGIGLIIASPGWSVTVDKIRIDLSSVQSATDYFEIDWAAIGRPAPGASSAQLTDEQTARASADAAEVTARETLATALIGQVNPTGLTLSGLTGGLVYSERVARSTADTSLASDISALSSTVTNNYNTLNSLITTESAARVSGDSAEASSRSTLATQIRGAYTGTDVTQLSAGLLFNERVARSTADTSLASDISTLSATVTGNYNTLNSAVVSETNARASGDQAEASARGVLSAQLRGSYTGTDVNALTEGLIYSERVARVTAISSEASSRSALATQLRGGYTGTDINALSSGLIYDERVARSTADSSLASSISLLSTTVNGNTTSIQTLTSSVNGVQGKYSLKIDNNGHVSGFGLISEANNGTVTSALIIRADRFAVVDPASTSNSLTDTPSADVIPFFVEGGVVYIKTAFIKDASISSAKIGSLAANKILAGNINAAIGINGGSVFGASLYSGGTVTVNGDGSFTANNPTFAVAGGNVDIVSANFRIKTLAAGGSTFTPFKVESGVVYIDSARIKDGDITTAQIQNALISNAQIIDLSADKITAGSLDAARLSIDGTTIDRYYDNSISKYRIRIADLGVTTAKIADLGVTTAKIGDLAVNSLKIAGNSVTLPITYSAADVYISSPIVKTSGGNYYSYNYVGTGNGDYEYTVVYYDEYYNPIYDYVFVGAGNGDYVRVMNYVTPTFTGATTVIETPWITVGDAVGGGAMVCFYATYDASAETDAGQMIYLLINKNDGNGYIIASMSLMGTNTSGGQSYLSASVAMPYVAESAQSIRIKVVTGTRKIGATEGTNSSPSYLRNILVTVLGRKR